MFQVKTFLCEELASGYERAYIPCEIGWNKESHDQNSSKLSYFINYNSHHKMWVDESDDNI
jgi:hypothetical protein